ncbi:MAG: hypothetical protein WDZ75_00700 [Candidatus Paceibacterota bacterium]
MYFWNIQKLKSDLREKPLSEGESFKYLFANLLVYSLAMIPFLENNIWDVYIFVIAVPLMLFGAYYVYRCNGGAGGTHFLQRYFSIGWVVGIRWLVLIALPVLVLYIIAQGMYSEIPDSTTLTDVVVYNSLAIAFYWLFGKHIKEVAQQ